LFLVSGMIMTTVSDPNEMSAGEILYIARNNIRKKWNLLTAAYPAGGMRGIISPLQEAFEEADGRLMLDTEVDSVISENGTVKGVKIKKKSRSPYPGGFYMNDHFVVDAPLVVCAIPLWHLDKIICMNPRTSALSEAWLKRYADLKYETTGFIGHTAALSEPVYDKPNFLCALKLPNTGAPFQAFVPSAFDPGVAPQGKSLLQTGCVVERSRVLDKFEAQRLLEAMWLDIQEMFPGIDQKVEWKFSYKCAGCDGLARKPGKVGTNKPDIKAPGPEGLYFAGDCYRGRGLALNSAALSAWNCAGRILEKHGLQIVKPGHSNQQ
jgi:prolycopene isomerase